MEVDCVRVKGKSLPVKIYQLLAHKKIALSQSKLIALFHDGLAFYKQRQWDKAIKFCVKVQEMDGNMRDVGQR